MDMGNFGIFINDNEYVLFFIFDYDFFCIKKILSYNIKYFYIIFLSLI